MESLKNAFKAPFSDEAAAATTPAKTAVAYCVAGFLVGLFMK